MDATFEEVLALALRLAPKERLQLIEEMAFSVEADFEPAPPEPEPHWGQSLVRLLTEPSPIEMANPEIEDPVEWVKEQRRKDAERLQSYWDDEQ